MSRTENQAKPNQAKPVQSMSIFKRFFGDGVVVQVTPAPPPPPPVRETRLEERIFNPLGARIGSTLEIDDFQNRGLRYQLNGMTVRKFTVQGTERPLIDYRLAAHAPDNPLADAEGIVERRLRVIPRVNQVAGANFRCCLLKKVSEFEYDHAFTEGIAKKRKFIWGYNEGSKDAFDVTYEQDPNDTSADRFVARSQDYADRNGDGIVSPKEVRNELIEYWGFEGSRERRRGDPKSAYIEVAFMEFCADEGPRQGYTSFWAGEYVEFKDLVVDGGSAGGSTALAQNGPLTEAQRRMRDAIATLRERCNVAQLAEDKLRADFNRINAEVDELVDDKGEYERLALEALDASEANGRLREKSRLEREAARNAGMAKSLEPRIKELQGALDRAEEPLMSAAAITLRLAQQVREAEDEFRELMTGKQVATLEAGTSVTADGKINTETDSVESALNELRTEVARTRAAANVVRRLKPEDYRLTALKEQAEAKGTADAQALAELKAARAKKGAS